MKGKQVQLRVVQKKRGFFIPFADNYLDNLREKDGKPIDTLGQLAENTLNYIDGDGKFVIAPNTLLHRRAKREWELRQYGKTLMPEE